MPGKYMVRCDIEGVTGVVSYAQAEPGRDEYACGQRWFMGDLLALLAGLQAGGAGEVVIYDEHYDGRNIDLAALPAAASAICGKPPYRPDWPGGLDESFDGVILLGFHSMFATPGGLLAHSYEPDIRRLRLSGVPVGEIGMEAAVAGDCGVGVALVTCDSAGAAEAEALLPGVRCVVVKEALGESGARCLSAEATAETIRAAAESVVRDPPAVQPLRFEPPVRLEVRLNDGPYLQAVRDALGEAMTDERTLVIDGPSATAVWAEYWQAKLRCQARMEF